MHTSKFTYILIQQKWLREKLKLWGKTAIQVSWKCWNTEFLWRWSNVEHCRPPSGTTVSSRRTCSWDPSHCLLRSWTSVKERRDGTVWVSFTDDTTNMNLHLFKQWKISDKNQTFSDTHTHKCKFNCKYLVHLFSFVKPVTMNLLELDNRGSFNCDMNM